MEIKLMCSICKKTEFEITTDELLKIYVDDLDNFIGEYYTFSFVCTTCGNKVVFSTGSN